MLRVDKLSKSFTVEKGQVRAVQQVSLDIPEGQFFTMLGPSGSGKSTTLRCIAGLEQPESGQIFIGDQCVYSSEKRVFIPPDERPIGMVFQSYAIWPHMDVYRNVAFPLLYGSKKKRLPKDQIRQLVMEALKTVQMEGLVDRPATQLSGGQQQRVALARALVRKPKLLLLDEPLSNLDAKLREEMRVELKELTHSVGITTFFVTHDQLEALALSDLVGVIIEGNLVEVGAPYEMYVHPEQKLVAEFLGTANCLDGKITRPGPEGEVDTPIGRLQVTLGDTLGANDPVTVVIRPEGVRCTHEKPRVDENLFQGKMQRAIFLGTFIDGEVEVSGKTFRALLNPYEGLLQGQDVFVRLPRERCQIIRIQ